MRQHGFPPEPLASLIHDRHDDPDSATAGPIHVLLVEDDAEAAMLVRMSLTKSEQEGFQLEWSPNLTQAMKRVGHPGIDVVLLDLGLPEMTGYRSQRALEASTAYRVPMVILTGDDAELSRDLTMGNSVSAYLVKDQTSPSQIRQALYRAVHEHRCAPCAA
ncbi:MAG: response regulator [Acidobacteria bacterium]|nr:response regulator [Acidobacteriota bacterium]